MQSDKLPKMPDAPYWLPIGDRKSASIIDVYTAQQMQDYALAVRKAALEESAAVAWAAVMDECKERGLSPAIQPGSGWFKVVQAIRSIEVGK